MKRRFLIAVKDMTAEHEKAFANYLQGSDGGSYWHWIDNVWLFVTLDPSISTTAIRDAIDEVAGPIRSLIVEVSGEIDWSGKGPSTANLNMFDWLRRTWQEIPDSDSEEGKKSES